MSKKAKWVGSLNIRYKDIPAGYPKEWVMNAAGWLPEQHAQIKQGKFRDTPEKAGEDVLAMECKFIIGTIQAVTIGPEVSLITGVERIVIPRP